MKKILAFVLGICLILGGVSCNATVEKKTVKLGVVDGAPSLSVTNILADGFSYSTGEVKYEVEVDLVGGAQIIRSGLISGEYDMAIAPLNLASALYNAKPELGIKLASVNIFGCLYVIGSAEVTDMTEYKGKTVISVGAGGTPDVIFRNLLTENGIGINGEDENDSEKVTMTYASEASGVIASFKKNEADFAILGEPAVSTICSKTGKVIAMDLQSEWKKVHNTEEFVQAGLFVTGKLAENSELLNAIITKLELNTDFVNSNISELNGIFENAQSTLKSVAFSEELIGRCNIGCKRANKVKTAVSAFLKALYDYNPSQIGGKLPGDDFYIQ